MAVASVQTLTGILKDYWVKVGVPQELYDEASPAWQMVSKAPDTSWVGASEISGVSRPTLNWGSKAGLPGGGSPTLNDAWTNPSNTLNVKWQATPNKFWQVMQLDFESIEFTSNADGSYEKAQLIESVGHVKRYQNILSTYFWGNGGGAFAKLGGAGAAQTGTTLSLRNSNNTLRFAVGDRLQAAITDGTSGAVKAQIYTVTQRDESSGTLEVTPSTTGLGTLDNDYLFLAGTFGNVFQGYFSWNPITSAQAATTFFNVDRSQDIAALAGSRQNISVGDDPWQTIIDLLQIASRNSANIDAIFTSETVMNDLLTSSRPQVLVNGNRWETNKASPIRDDPDKLRYGVEGLCVRWPNKNKDVYIYSDRYLSDIEQTAENDIIFVGTKMDDWKFCLSKYGMSWRSYDGNGPAYWIQGQETIGSFYGSIGQVVTWNTRNMIVLAPSVS